jgi:hypothetical protein
LIRAGRRRLILSDEGDWRRRCRDAHDCVRRAAASRADAGAIRKLTRRIDDGSWNISLTAELCMAILILVGMLAIKGLALLAVVYVGARLAIRHERQMSN